MTQKAETTAHSPKPWYWGLNQGSRNRIPDGPYAEKFEALSGYFQNGSGLRPTDSIMDNIADNLAVALRKTKP